MKKLEELGVAVRTIGLWRKREGLPNRKTRPKGPEEKAVTSTICAHIKCGKPAIHIECFDDHDSNAGTYYLDHWCSLECFVCDLKHAADDNLDAPIRKILARIEA